MNRLHVKRLVSVGAVEIGDNPSAEILLYKSKSAESAEPRERDHMSRPDLSALDDAVRKTIEEYLDEIEANAVEEPEPVLTDLPEPVAKALAERDGEIVKEREARESLQKELDTMRDEQLTERFEKRASDFVAVLGEDDEIGDVLKDLASAAPDAYAKLDVKLAEAVTMVEASDRLMFKELGTSNDESDPKVKHLAIAKTIYKEEKDEFGTMALAKAEAWRRNPDLVTESRAV